MIVADAPAARAPTARSDAPEEDARHSRSIASLAQWLSGPPLSLDALFLGDSTFERLGQADTDRRSLGRMLLDAGDWGDRARAISRSAYTTREFAGVLAAAKRLGWRSRAVAMILNSRSFGPIWMGEPKWRFIKERRWLDAIAMGGDSPPPPPCQDDATVDDCAFRQTPLTVPGAACATVGDFQTLLADHAEASSARRLREVFTVYHGFTIEPDHPMLDAAGAAVMQARAVADQVHLYVAPVNIEAGVRWVGESLAHRVAENVTTLTLSLRARTADGAVHVHDLSRDFPSDAFVRPEQPTEHLNDSGRRMLAARLNQAIGRSIASPSLPASAAQDVP